MITAAEALMIERGTDDFLLSEVSRVGKVSIGSIYNRFSGKDELIHAVHVRAMERLEADQAKIVIRARSRSRTAQQLVRALLEDVAEFLKLHAPIMRPLMLRAAFDRAVQDRGRIAHDLMADAVAAEMLTERHLIRHRDPERAVHAVIRIAYAAFARELGFGMAEAPQGGVEWSILKEDVGAMAVSYLFGTLSPDEDDQATN